MLRQLSLIPNPNLFDHRPIPIGKSTRLSRVMHAKNLFFIYAIASIFFCIMSALFLSNSIRFDRRRSSPSTIRSNRPFPTTAAMAAEKKGIPETFYISHGSPTLSIDDSLPARPFLKSFQQKILPEKPKAILIISGHWETAEPAVNAVSGPSDTIYDFYGFPDRMYKLKYPAPGSPQLANRVKELLQKAGFETVHVDKKRGLDHGAWVPLMLMYPEADIPVCQLSVQTEKDGKHHYRMGEALRPLKDDGVLIVGSGAATHNLRKMNRDGSNAVEGWARDFDSWIKEALEEGRYEDVNRYEERAPNAKMAHPWPDHFYPLHVAMGAAGENTKGELIHHSWTHGTLSYASYKFVEK